MVNCYGILSRMWPGRGGQDRKASTIMTALVLPTVPQALWCNGPSAAMLSADSAYCALNQP